MWQRRFVALVVVVGVAFVAPNATAASLVPDIKDLPRPVRTMTAPSVAGAGVLVKYKPGVLASEALAGRRATVVGEVDGTDFVKVRAWDDPNQLVAALRQDESVDTVTLDYARRATGNPNDQLFNQYQPYLNTVRLPAAWDRITNASSQVIAVVDTGVDTAHPDLVGRVVGGFNVVDPASPPTDQVGHGTMVAGIAAANTNNGIGVAGAAWNGRIMPVQVFTGVGEDAVAYDSDVATGIIWATDNDAKIINLSLGGPGDGPVLHAAVRYATERGALVVAAAGNDGNDVVQYPAAYPEVLAVGATDQDGRLTDFSSFGDWVDVAAPGFAITSTFPTASGFQYATGDGTSFSAPLVSGVAALIRAANPGFGPAQVAQRLLATARDAGPPGNDPYFGAGILDAAYAVGGSFGAAFPTAPPDSGEPNDVPARAIEYGWPPGTSTLNAYQYVEGDTEWYSYYEQVGARSLRIAVTPPPFDPQRAVNLDPVLEVYDADLGLLAKVDDHPAGEGESATLALGVGWHYIRISNYNGSAGPLGYTLGITLESTQQLFDPADYTQVGTSMAKSVAIGDVTGDGRPDALFGTSPYFDPTNDYKLFVRAQKPDGTLADPVRYTPVQSSFETFALVDADKDGRLDVAIAGAGGVEILRQNTAGALVSAGLLPGVPAPAYDVIATDMDGDGDGDLVVGGLTGVTLLTHGAGMTFAVSSVTTDPVTDGELDAGDLDGDGRIDLASVTSFLSSSMIINVYHRTGSGWNRTQHSVGSGTGFGSTGGIEVADVTGDGRADLVASTWNPYQVVVLGQRPDGSLADQVGYGVQMNGEPVEAADLTGDGRTDVVVAHGSNASLLVQMPDGRLNLTTALPGLGASHIWNQGLALGDLNSDGANDIVAASHNKGLVVLRHTANAQLSPAHGQGFVRDVAPSDASTGAPLTIAPRITFQVPLDPASATAESVQLLDGRSGATVPSTVSYDDATRTVTVTPSALLQDNKPYRIAVDGVRGAAGSAPRFTTTFTTVDAAPSAPAGFSVQSLPGAARVTFAPPGDLDQTIVRMAVGTTPPNSPTAGTSAYIGPGSDITIGGLNAGTTYSFAVYYRDRAGQLSPPRTATLVGTGLTIEATSSASPVVTSSPVMFTATLTRIGPAGPLAGQQVQLLVTCRGRVRDAVVATATSSAGGTVSASLTQLWPECSYHWELRGSSQFMGASSSVVQVKASIAMPPGQPPRRGSPR